MPILLRIRGGARTSDPDPYKAYLERLLKLIPAEVVGLYLAGRSAIQAAYGGNTDDLAVAAAAHPAALPYWLGWTLFCFVAVVWVRAWATSDRRTEVAPEWPAVAIASVSFLVWVYSLGDVFAQFPGAWRPLLSTLLVLAWTFVVPLLYRDDAPGDERDERLDFTESDAQEVVLDAATALTGVRPELDEKLADRLPTAAHVDNLLLLVQGLISRRYRIRVGLALDGDSELEGLGQGIYGRLAAGVAERIRQTGTAL